MQNSLSRLMRNIAFLVCEVIVFCFVIVSCMSITAQYNAALTAMPLEGFHLIATASGLALMAVIGAVWLVVHLIDKRTGKLESAR